MHNIYDTTAPANYSPSIKPIPTRFDGFLFRSRLEARWAVFLRALDIDFEYEMEGFRLPGVGGYLPDFYLPKVRMWAEVKPEAMNETERAKCIALAEHSDRPVLHLIGSPDFKFYTGSCFNRIEDEVLRYEVEYFLDIDYHARRFYNEGRLFACPPAIEPEFFSVQYWGAVFKSRMARFEAEAA